MKRFMTKLCTLFLVPIIAPHGFASDECTVELLNDFRVSSEFLEVSTGGSVLYEIRQGGELSVGGEALSLDAGQRELAQQYAGDVGALASQWVELVSAVLEVAGETLPAAFNAAFGEGSEAAVQSAVAIERAKLKFESIAKPEDGIYSVTAAEFNDLGAVMGDEIEDAVTASVGALLIEVGKSISSGEGSLHERMEAFGQRMDAMGEELEHMGESLEGIGDRLCAELEALQELELRVGREIPELEEYPVFGR
jgi:hypothetical protein